MIKEVKFVIEAAKQIMDDSMRTAHEFDESELSCVELQAEVIKKALAFQNMFDESYKDAFEYEQKDEPLVADENANAWLAEQRRLMEMDKHEERGYTIDRGRDLPKDEFYTSYIQGHDKTIVWHVKYAPVTAEISEEILLNEIVHWQFGGPEEIDLIKIANDTLEGKIRKEDL